MLMRLLPEDMERDPELQDLRAQVERLFGEDACCAANNRAYNRAYFARDRDGDEWLFIFAEAWKAELRRLLVLH
jgi:hypothetical protein